MNRFQQAAGIVDNGIVVAAHQFTIVTVQIQLAVLVVAAGISLVVAALLRRRTDPAIPAGWPDYLRLFASVFVANLGTVFFVVLVLIARIALAEAGLPSRFYLLGIAANLAIAWVVIALVASLIRNPFIKRVVSVFFWLVAALNIVGLIQPIRVALDSVAVVIGGLRISPLLLIKTTVLLLMTLWVANALSDFLDRRMRGVTDLTPSLQVLIGKLVRLLLITFAIVVVLSTVGIDFSALAFFSGAIGVGLGFGLQRIVSNLVSGIILLADKSIKPGDVITVGDKFGWVHSMGARYIAVGTRDGREFLIPNEDFITQRVINWSFSNDQVRIDVDFGVSYNSDPHKVIATALEAVKPIKRILASPPPGCQIKAFGPSSIDFILMFWIRDPVQGLINIRGQVLLALWDAFKAAGIEIPFPQQDVTMRAPVRVILERDGTSTGA